MTKLHTFPCGCSFPILHDEPLKLDFKIRSANLDCPAVWQLFSKGLTKGVFQLDSRLGQIYAKKLKAENIDHIGGILTALRPGCLAFRDENGVSVTEHYCRRKNALEEVTSLHKEVDDVLRDTYNLILYQEQIIFLSQRIAGFSLQEADDLRKAMGKKIAELMTQVRNNFIEKGIKEGKLTEEELNSLFDNIEKSQRYIFNKCLTLDTLVETKNGFKSIEDVEIGEYVKAPNFNSLKDEFVCVIDKHDNGQQEVYEITMESGKTITCTLSHRFLCEDKVTRPLIEILENGHKILCSDD